MMVQSMTAFTRMQGEGPWGSAVWEIRSINHRYLDVSFKLPETMRVLEGPLRETLKTFISRGKVEISLRFKPGESVQTQVGLNQALASSLIITAKNLANEVGSQASIDISRILAWPGVLDIKEVQLESAQNEVLSLFETALKDLVAARQREGEVLKSLLEQRMEGVQLEVDKVKAILPEILEAGRKRLIDRFNEAKLELDSERVEQEMLMVAQKTDVMEEIDRLETHVKETRRILSKGGDIGRRLDFLMQEFNREANTLGSKSIDARTTLAAVEAKVLIEQMREQVQNIQ